MQRSTTNSPKSIAGLLIGLAWIALIRAETNGLHYQVSWLGNSFSGASNRWVQNFFIHMNTRPDGTCYTWSHWDEGGKKFGVYRDGDVVDNKDGHANSLEVTDPKGHLWKIKASWVDPKHNEYDFSPEGITRDGTAIVFPELFQPTALAWAPDDTLAVADSGTGPRQQILFYNVQVPENPRLLRAFGDYGGIHSGIPGQVTPTKFWGIRGVGFDAQTNIYVAQSEMGSVLRKFTPTGELVWELYDHFFVDVACADPLTDGNDIWGVQEHYQLVDEPPAGGLSVSSGKWVGYSLDRQRYPNDPRGLTFVKQQGEHGVTSPQVVYLGGKRFLFTGGMFASNFINIFRFEGEIAVPSALIMQWGGGLFNTDLKWPPFRPPGTFIWRDLNGDGDYQTEEFAPNATRVHPGPFWVDQKGNIWMAYGFFRYDFQGLDARGNPIYQADKVTVMEPPKGVSKVARVYYDSDRDLLVVADEGEDMRHIRKVSVCPNYLAGNRETTAFESGAGREAACLAVAGDYTFTGGWKERGRIWVNRLSDGAAVGVLEPGSTVGGVAATGWIDLLTGITAHRRKNGEYFVFVEEDYRAKVLLYRWRP